MGVVKVDFLIVQRCSVGPYLSIEPLLNMFQNFFVVIRFCLGNTFGLTLDLKENVKFFVCISGHPPMMSNHVAKGIRFLSLLIFQKNGEQTDGRTDRRTSCNYNIDVLMIY